MSWKVKRSGFTVSVPPARSGRRDRLTQPNISRENTLAGGDWCWRGVFAIGVAWTILSGAMGAAHAQTVLTTEYISVPSTGGSQGSGSANPISDMVYSQWTSDGWGWAGGAGAVQGSSATHNGQVTGGTVTAANEALGFNVGATVDSLNTTYGAGNWTIANPTLTFWSSYNVEGNSRFGLGNGTFDILWVGNDNWGQSKGVQGPPPNYQLNPIYATSQAVLNTWAGSSSLLGSETYSLTDPANSGGYQFESYSLAVDPSFVQDITSATAAIGGDPYASLYLMDTTATTNPGKDALGMIIFTGGQQQSPYPTPTLSFQVVSVPEPASLGLLAGAVGGVVVFRRLRRRKET